MKRLHFNNPPYPKPQHLNLTNQPPPQKPPPQTPRNPAKTTTNLHHKKTPQNPRKKPQKTTYHSLLLPPSSLLLTIPNTTTPPLHAPYNPLNPPFHTRHLVQKHLRVKPTKPKPPLPTMPTSTDALPCPERVFPSAAFNIRQAKGPSSQNRAAEPLICRGRGVGADVVVIFIVVGGARCVGCCGCG